MTDHIRKLAERIEAMLFDANIVTVDAIERILREHHEALRAELLAEWASLGGRGDGEWAATMTHVLEGGGQATSKGHADPAGSSSPIQESAAPNQPHKFVPWRDADHLGCSHRRPSGSPCFLPADHPIHQTNEVSDDRARGDCDDGCPDDGSVSVAVSGRVTADQPQVTNYDAEAEARAREGVWVGPGDEVLHHHIKGHVVGLSRKYDGLVVFEGRSRDCERVRLDSLRTPTGQPVLGYRERSELAPFRVSELLGEQAHRIAELERERDEARAARDAHAEMVAEFQRNHWVRLDDETIERVAGKCHRLGADFIAAVLRDLRDGKLKEAGDDDA